MGNWLEIVIPVRNPGDKLLESVACLLSQESKDYGVILSDNVSTQGLEFIESAQAQLKKDGIPVRVVRPTEQLGRVEHWNWAHSRSEAAWLKPLFVGDLLAPTYVTRLKERVIANPSAQVVRCEFQIDKDGQLTPAAQAPPGAERLSPGEFLQHFPQLGNWIGSPINMAYSRNAWESLGGYSPQLPACADFNLYVALILRYGVELIPDALATFQLHTQRFSHGIQRRQVVGCFEVWISLLQARNYCVGVGLAWPEYGVRRGLWKQIGLDYLHPCKQKLKGYLGVS